MANVLSTCLCAVAAAGRAGVALREIVGYAQFDFLVLHSALMILREQETSVQSFNTKMSQI